MPRDGSGNYSRTNGVFSGPNTWDQQAASIDPTIRSDQHDTHDEDIATALTGSVARDGQSAMTGALNMANNKITNLGDSTAEQDAPNRRQVQADVFAWCGTAGGTANAILLTPSFAISSYSTKQRFVFIAAQGNDDVVTVNVSGVGARSLLTADGKELRPGDLDTNLMVVMEYNGTAFQVTSPTLNPRGAQALNISGTTSYTVKVSDDKRLITVNSNLGATTITLPAASEAGSGFFVSIKKISLDKSDITIAANGAETIDGANSISFRHQNDHVTIMCTGVTWYIMGASVYDLKAAIPLAGVALNVNFTGILPGAKQVVISCHNVAQDSAASVLVRIGDSAGLKITGYTSTSMLIPNGALPENAFNTTGFIMFCRDATYALSGNMIISLMSGDTWISSHSGRLTDTDCCTGGGEYASGLDANGLSQLEFRRTGGATQFTGGEVAIRVLY